MARRKKEDASVHRECIARAAETLFLKKGILATTMDDIAKTAKYSKPTLYVYFKNKEEIVGVLALKSMKLLHERIGYAISEGDRTRVRYQAICNQLVDYQETFPLYYELVTREINVDFDADNALPVEREIFEVGEQIMGELSELLRKGIEEKVLRGDIHISQTVFLFWASLSGIIVMASQKQRYIQKAMGITKQQFLQESFDTLFRSICREGIVL